MEAVQHQLVRSISRFRFLDEPLEEEKSALRIDSVERPAQQLHPERIVIGMFDKKTSLLRIIFVKWRKHKSTDAGKSKMKYEFDFTGQLKEKLTSGDCLFYIDDYDSSNIYFVPAGKRTPMRESVSIPDSWKEQRIKTAKVTHFEIVSKVVLPIFFHDKSGFEYLWGVCFFENSHPRLYASAGKESIEYFRLVADAYSEMLIAKHDLKQEVYVLSENLKRVETKENSMVVRKALLNVGLSVLSMIIGTGFVLFGGILFSVFQLVLGLTLFGLGYLSLYSVSQHYPSNKLLST